MMLTAVLRLCGQVSGGPSGVPDQSVMGADVRPHLATPGEKDAPTWSGLIIHGRPHGPASDYAFLGQDGSSGVIGT